VLAAAAAMAAAEVVERRRTWFKIVYNVANLTLSIAIASLVWQLGGASGGLGSLGSIPWVVPCVLSYFLVNTLLTAAIVSFVLHLPIGSVWWRSHRQVLLGHLGVLFVGVPIAGLWLSFPWMLVCVAVALVALHYAVHDRVKLETQTLESLFDLADILDARDKYTHGHSERVGAYAEQLAVQLGLSSERTHLVFLAGRLHDIGKCAITNEVLLKPAALDEEERDAGPLLAVP
jgi:HD-GYP domain-containing protein (c-di-GMP phosphodiesterase class II)